MPYGPGSGNGTGGSRGARGVVASTGFGSGVATGNSSGPVSGLARHGSPGRASETPTSSPVSQPKAKSAEPVVKTLPVEITFKPRPVYTDEGRQLKIEGEVLLDVVFSATGQIRIVKVVRGLGHGLDESAVHAAEKIQFKPAQKTATPRISRRSCTSSFSWHHSNCACDKSYETAS
jgi:TonB family protein